MRVTLLGTGSALPSPDRVQSGVLVTDDDRRVLVDCGSGVVHRMAQHRVDHLGISTVLLTHHHLDHVADLPTLLKARVLQDEPECTIAGPPGTRAVLEGLLATDNLIQRADLRIEEYSEGTERVTVGGMTVEPVSTRHSAASHAYRFDDRLVVSGDTPPDEAIFSLADGVHTLVHECAYPDSVTTDDHTTPAGLRAGLDEISLERVVLTHLFPAAEQAAEAILAEMASTDAEMQIAEDGMALAIPDR